MLQRVSFMDDFHSMEAREIQTPASFDDFGPHVWDSVLGPTGEFPTTEKFLRATAIQLITVFLFFPLDLSYGCMYVERQAAVIPIH